MIFLFNLTFKSETDPLAIKLSNKLSLLKNISISVSNFPSSILLFKKLLMFDGFNTIDIFLRSLILILSKIKFIFFNFISDLIKDKKSI